MGDSGGFRDADRFDSLLRATFGDREREAGADVAGLAAAARAGYARRTARRRQALVVGTVGVLAVGGSSAVALVRHGAGGGVKPGAANGSVASSESVSASGSAAASPSAGPATGAGTATGTGTATPTQGLNGWSSGPNVVPPTSSAPTVTGPSQNLAAADPLPVKGSRAWSSHGLQIRVPEAWPANKAYCGVPTVDTVLIGGGPVEACALDKAPVVNAVEFGGAAFPDLSPMPVLHPAAVSGVAAQVGTERLDDGRSAAIVIVPDLSVSIVVKTKDPALLAQILATAQVVDTDANGCASRADSVVPAGRPVRPGAQQAMVPGSPVKAIVCHYESPVYPGHPAADGPTPLTNGSQVAPDQIGGLVDLLNSLTPGLAAWQGLAGACAPAAHDGYLLRFSYASGPPVDVYLHSENCDQMGFSNGAVTGLIPQKLVENSQRYLPDMPLVTAGEAVSK